MTIHDASLPKLSGSKGGSKTTNTADNLFSTDVVEALIGISEGPIKGLKDGAKSYYIGDTTLLDPNGASNFDNFELIDYKGSELGEDIHSRLGGFGSSISVNTQLAPFVPVIRTGTHTQIDYLDLRFSINQLVVSNEKGTFQHTGKWKIEYKAESATNWTPVRTSATNPLPPQIAGDSFDIFYGEEGTETKINATPGDRPTFWASLEPISTAKAAIWFDTSSGYKPKIFDGKVWAFPDALVFSNSHWTWSEASSWGDDKSTKAFVGAKLPADAIYEQGDYWLNTAANRAMFFNGSTWVVAGSTLRPGTFGEHGTGGTVEVTEGEIHLTGKVTQSFPKEFRLPVERINEPYMVRVTRVTPLNTTEELFDITFESFQEIVSNAYKFPALATTQLVARASEQFSSIPDFSGIYQGRIIRVPSNYDHGTRQYSGIWDGTWKLSYSNNPAFVAYDLVMHDRYGMNAYYPITMNKWDVYEAGVWCDTLNANGRPRFTYNGLISDPRGGRDALNYICGIFAGRFFDDGNGTGVIKIDRDGGASAVFSPENVVDGLLTYSFTEISTRHNDITVTFINPDLMWQEDRRRVFDQDHIDYYGRIPHNFIAVGCTNVEEAIARARYHLITGTKETILVNFKTNRMGLYLGLYEIILLADPDMDFGLSGRVREVVNERQIDLRDAIYLEPGFSHSISFQVISPATNDFVIETRELIPVTGSLTRLTVTEDLPELPADALFTITQTNGDAAPVAFRVMSINEIEGDPDNVEVQAVQMYRPKWLYIDGYIDDPSTVDHYVLNTKKKPEPVSNVRVRAQSRRIGTRTATTINLDWDKSPTKTVSRYKIEGSRNNGPMATLAETSLTQFEWDDIPVGEYLFQITAIDVNGYESKSALIEHRLIGDYLAVEAVSELRLVDGADATTYENRSPTFKWARNTTASFEQYKVQVCDLSGVVIREEFVDEPTYTYEYPLNLADNSASPRRAFKIRVASKDHYGFLSDYEELTVNNPSPAVPTTRSVTLRQGVAVVKYEPPAERDFVGAVVYCSTTQGFTPSAATLKYKGPNTDIPLDLTGGTTQYIRLGLYDVFGDTGLNFAPEMSVAVPSSTADTVPPAKPQNLIVSAGMGFLTVEWTKPLDGDLAAVELFYNTVNNSTTASFGASSSGTSAVIPGLSHNQLYYVWARAVDTSGNRSDFFGPQTGTPEYINGASLLAGSITAGKLSPNSVEVGNIVANAITAAKIAANAVTPGMIAANAVAVDAIAANAVIAGKIAANAVNNNHLQDLSVLTNTLAANAVTTAKIAANAVTAEDIAALAITSAKIADNAILTQKLAANAVTSAQLAANAVTADQLAANIVASQHLVANAVEATNLAANAVTAAKLAANTVSTLNMVANAVTAAKLAANAVTSAQLAANAVTADQLAANIVSSQHLVANAVEAVNLAGNAVTAAKLAANTVSTLNMVANAVTAGQLAANAVTPSQLAANAVTAGKLASSAIETRNLAANAVTAHRIATNTIETRNLAANAVTVAELAANAVATAQLASNAVTSDALAELSVTAAAVADAAIETRKIAANAVIGSSIDTAAITGTHITSNAISTIHVAAGAITANEVSANAVITAKIAANAVTATQIIANGVTTVQIAANAVTAAQILASAVTAGKIAANSITAAEIAANSITGQLIAANTITGDLIAANSITGDLIAANTITGDLIVANSITANELLVGDFTNLLPNPNFTDDARGWFYYGPTGSSVTPYSGPEGVGLLITKAAGTAETGARVNNIFTDPVVVVRPGEQYLAKCSVTRKAGNNGGNLGLYSRQFKLDGTNSSVPIGAVTNSVAIGETKHVSSVFTIPEDTFGISWQIYYGSSASSANGSVAITNMSITKMAGGEVIIDGSLTAEHIAANTLTAAQIAAGTITSAEIAANTITAANITSGTITSAEIAANTITAANIAANTITASELLANTVTAAKIAANTITAAKIAAGTITSAEIAANTITAAKIAAGTITSAEIAANTITAAHLVANTISTAHIIAGAVTTAEIAANTITAANIAANTITANELLANTVTAAKIAANTITAAKIAAATITSAEIAANTITAAKIAAATITSAEIAANTITAAKIAAATITSAEIAVDAITATQLAAGSVTAAAILANTITATQLAAGSVTTAEIAANTITAANIAANAVTTNEIAANTVRAANIAANAVTTNEIAANTITAANIAANAITANEIAAGTITGAKIAANTITAAQILTNAITANEIAANTITGAKIAANTITAAEIAANTITGAKIAANTITAAEIAANTITAKQLVLTDTTNIVQNSGFLNGLDGWAGLGTGVTVVDAPGTTPPSTKAMYLPSMNATNNNAWFNDSTPAFPCSGGDSYYLECWVYSPATANTNLRLQIRYRNSVNSTRGSVYIQHVGNTAGEWVKISGILTVPTQVGSADVTHMTVYLTNYSNGTAVEGWYVTNLICRKAAQANMIVDGSILTAKLAANTVTAAKIAANAITASEIAANAVTAAKIATNAVTADKINVTSLEAISANLGNVNISTANIGTLIANTHNIAVDAISKAYLWQNLTEEVHVGSSWYRRLSMTIPHAANSKITFFITITIEPNSSGGGGETNYGVGRYRVINGTSGDDELISVLGQRNGVIALTTAIKQFVPPSNQLSSTFQFQTQASSPGAFFRDISILALVLQR